MTSFRRLPPVVRVASLLRPLFPLGLFVTLAYMVSVGAWSSAHAGLSAGRVAVIAINLAVVGLGSSAVVRVYTARFRQPDRVTFPLASWQSQVRTMLALTIIPIGALVLALVIPPTARAFQLVFPASILGAVVCLAVTLSVGASEEAGA